MIKKDINKQKHKTNSIVQYTKKKCKTINKKNKKKKKNGKRYTNSHKKNITRGGWRKLLTNEDLNTFVNPHNNNLGHEKDCCSSVFALFGLNEDSVRHYQRVSITDGLTIENIQDVMKQSYPDYTHTFQPSLHIPTFISNGGSIQNILLQIYNSIPRLFGYRWNSTN